jgi:hypothetical protein
MISLIDRGMSFSPRKVSESAEAVPPETVSESAV